MGNNIAGFNTSLILSNSVQRGFGKGQWSFVLCAPGRDDVQKNHSEKYIQPEGAK